MNHSHFVKRMLLAAAAVGCLGAASAAGQPDNPELQPPVRQGRTLAGDEGQERMNVASGGYNRLQGPDGTMWYYTAEYEMEDVYYNEYYTDHILCEFTFRIYDSAFRLKGTVRDKIHYASNEIRDRECVIDPTVTTRFFNTDDKPEIMVYHAMNTDVYINHYYYSVYTVGGEKDEEGYDRRIATVEGMCLDDFNNSSSRDEENYVITFVTDPYVDIPLDDPDYVAKLNELTYHITTYTKAVNDTDGPVVYLEKDIYGTRLPGDTTDDPYFLSKNYGGERFFIFSQYGKPFFVDPRGSAEDESATPDNSLVIEVYEVTGSEPRYVSFTEIPVNAEPSTPDRLVYTFMGIGSVTWANDVDMKYHGTPEAPAFLVARDVANAADIDNMRSSYYIYSCTGERIATLAEDTESIFIYQNGDPEGPMAMFVKYDDSGAYIFVFAFLYTGERLATISQNNGGDPLYATCYPVKMDGEYKFAIEMMYLDTDEFDNAYARIAWFGKEDDGPERIDRINVGKDVQAAMVYLSSVTLNPRLFDEDDAMEYAALVKRSFGNTVRNEYLVVDDNGGRYATFSADDGKGEPKDFSIIQGRPDRIRVTYDSGLTTTVDLPFTTPSVLPDEGAQSGAEAVRAEESDADVLYDLLGRRVRKPGRGIYVSPRGKVVIGEK